MALTVVLRLANMKDFVLRENENESLTDMGETYEIWFLEYAVHELEPLKQRYRLSNEELCHSSGGAFDPGVYICVELM